MAAERSPLNRLEVLRALRISNWEAALATVNVTLTTGAFQTGFALWLGANDLWMGILGAIPTFAGLVQIVSSYWVERRGERKWFTAWFSGVGRMLWLPILLVPFLPESVRFGTFVGLFMLSSVLLSIPLPGFLSWLSDLVPPDHRGRYFGRRNMIAGLTGMVVSLPAGWALDVMLRGEGAPALGFQVLFGVALLFGAAGFVCLIRQPEPPMQRMEVSEGGVRALLDFYRAPFREANFRRFLAFSGFFALAQFIAAPFYTVYALRELQMSYTLLQVTAAVSGLSSLVSMPLWGYLSDKFGNKPLLIISVFGTALLPVAWAFTSREYYALSIAIIFVINGFGGAAWAGVGLAGFNLLIGATPAERKSVYVGAMSAVTGLIGGVAPILGGVFMAALHPVSVPLFGLDMGNYQLLFTLNTLLRFASLALLRGVTDAGATSAREVLSQLGASRPGAWMQIRQLQRGGSEATRRRAAQSLRSTRTALAVEELIAALGDPSLRVREEAAVALGEIRDPRAVEPLVRCLEDPASGIADRAADALGLIGSPTAVEALAGALRAENEPEAAARALGRIGGQAAVDVLMEVLAATPVGLSDDTTAACITALGTAADPRAVPLLVPRLSGARTARLAAVRALGDIGDRSATEPLVALLARETDQAVISHAAVSLASVGGEGAVEALLDVVERVPSPVARKQVLHAVGTLMDEDGTFYTMLAADPMERDEAVSRWIRGLGRSAPGSGRAQFGTLRRSRVAERLLAHYLAGETAEAVRLLGRLAADASHRPPAAAAALDWAARTAERRSLTLDEFLLALYAARRIAA